MSDGEVEEGQRGQDLHGDPEHPARWLNPPHPVPISITIYVPDHRLEEVSRALLGCQFDGPGVLLLPLSIRKERPDE